MTLCICHLRACCTLKLIPKLPKTEEWQWTYASQRHELLYYEQYQKSCKHRKSLDGMQSLHCWSCLWVSDGHLYCLVSFTCISKTLSFLVKFQNAQPFLEMSPFMKHLAAITAHYKYYKSWPCPSRSNTSRRKATILRSASSPFATSLNILYCFPHQLSLQLHISITFLFLLTLFHPLHILQ